MAGAYQPQPSTALALPPTVAMSRRTASAVTISGDNYTSNGTQATGVNNGAGNTETPEQREAWTAFDKIPEVKTLVQGTANLLAQCRFYVGRRQWSNGREVDQPARDENGKAQPDLPEDLVAAAEDALSRYTDSTGAQAGLIRAQIECWQVVGTCRMVGYYVNSNEKPVSGPGKDTEERWVVVGPGSIVQQRRGTGTYWELQVTKTQKVELPYAIVHRFDWSSGRYPDEPSAWVLGALDICRDLRSFTMALRAAARSGIPADLFLVPTEASPKAVNPQGWGTGDEGAVVTAQEAADEWADKVESLVGEYAMSVLEDMNSGNTVVPGVLAVEGRFIEFFQKLSFARTVDRGLGELVRDARVRLAAAADAAPEMLKGLGNTNRWNGAQIAEDEYRRYYKPKADAMGDQWTQLLLWADLKTRGFNPVDYRKVRVLADASAIVASPDFSKLAPAAIDRGAIGPKGMRQLLNIPESAAPSPAEITFMEEWKQAGKPVNAGQGQGDTGAPTGSPNDVSTQSIATKAVEIPQQMMQSMNQSDDLSARLAAIESNTRIRLQEACEAALDKALEKASAHLRNWARKAKGDYALCAASHAIPEGFLVALGSARAVHLAETNTKDDEHRREVLFAAALAALLVHWRRIAKAAYAAALAAAGRELPPAEIDAAIERSVAVLHDSMMELADVRLFGKPGVPEPTVGEVTDLRVPSTLLNRVLAVAGGAFGVGAGLTPTIEAAVGLAWGSLMSRVLPARQGFRWVYGDPAERREPFPEHEQLDGVTFKDWNDDVLSGSPFAGGSYFCGDHSGCLCVAVPILAAS